MTDLTLPKATLNPAGVGNAPQTRVTEATRIPMSTPNAKLAVPEIPGYYLYWHRGANVPRALQAGYTFVSDDEVTVEQKGIANDPAVSGNTDLGTRVSVIAGGTVSETDLSPERLYLMKLPLDWHLQDMAKQEASNEHIARALRGGIIGADQDPDRNKRYMKAGQDLFYPKKRS